MDWWVFAEGTEAEAREYLEHFLEEGAAAAAAGFGDPKTPVLADFSLASVPEVLAWIGARVEVVEVPAPAEVPLWVQSVLDQNGAGFRDFAEASRPLVLHFVSQEPSYGNQLMDRIGSLTAGALAVNPNTMYPLLRSLEADGHVAGEWEHPERRSRRYYRITDAGREERVRLAAEVGPRLDRIGRSIESIRAELG